MALRSEQCSLICQLLLPLPGLDLILKFCIELIWLNCDSLIPHLLEACVRRDFKYDSGHLSEASMNTGRKGCQSFRSVQS